MSQVAHWSTAAECNDVSWLCLCVCDSVFCDIVYTVAKVQFEFVDEWISDSAYQTNTTMFIM